MKDYVRELSMQLSLARVRIKKKQSDIARELGTRIRNVQRLESGEQIPPTSKVPSIAEAYGMDEEMLATAIDLAQQQKNEYKKIRKSLTGRRNKKSSGDMFSGMQVLSVKTSAHFILRDD